MTMDIIEVPVSPGEVLDKITILEIKSERMSDAAKLVNVRRELALLQASRECFAEDTERAKQLVGQYSHQDGAVEELASWTATLRVLLNLDEFITRD